jgi:hypothetical protein
MENKDKKELKSLVGLSLASFTFIVMHEVYRTDFDGRRTAVVGYFKDPNIASAFAESKEDQNFHKTTEVLVLTNGVVHYLVIDGYEIAILNDEEEALKLKERALTKLSSAEKKILGL